MSDRFAATAAFAAALMSLSGVGLAQESSSARGGERQAQATAESAPDDIIVQGYQARTKLPTVAEPANSTSATRIRLKYENSERLAGCAARSRLSDRARLRAVVDGEFNSVTHAIAQDRLKRIYITCGESPGLLTMTDPDGAPPTTEVSPFGVIIEGSVVVDPAPLGHSIYDRGAFVIAAMKTYAPNLMLTREQTNDPVVQRRFNLREMPRNRFRLPVDYQYFQVAVCMVRLEPGLSVRLAMSDDPAKIDGVQATLINRARACVGNAKRVSVDPTQFRIYIADAVYRWVVATRDSGSLIPSS